MEGLSLVIPVHNGGDRIKGTIADYYNFFNKKFKKFEIIVVCNACIDNSFQICQNLSLKFPLKVLNEPRRGKGYALLKGFNNAQYDIIGFLDADNPFDLEEIGKMLNYLDKFDLVIVSKFLRGKLKAQTSLLRRIISIATSVVSRIIFDMNFRDTQAGAKFMRRAVWEKLKENLVCPGFEFDIELLYKCKKLNCKIFEYYISSTQSDSTTVKMRILPGIVYRLLKMRYLT